MSVPTWQLRCNRLRRLDTHKPARRSQKKRLTMIVPRSVDSLAKHHLRPAVLGIPPCRSKHAYRRTAVNNAGKYCMQHTVERVTKTVTKTLNHHFISSRSRGTSFLVVRRYQIRSHHRQVWECSSKVTNYRMNHSSTEVVATSKHSPSHSMADLIQSRHSPPTVQPVVAPCAPPMVPLHLRHGLVHASIGGHPARLHCTMPFLTHAQKFALAHC